MTVLMEELKTVKELGIKGCRECSFSTGGDMFAAVNGTTISVYNTYTCENVGNLRGHNGKVGLRLRVSCQRILANIKGFVNLC